MHAATDNAAALLRVGPLRARFAGDAERIRFVRNRRAQAAERTRHAFVMRAVERERARRATRPRTERAALTLAVIALIFAHRLFDRLERGAELARCGARRIETFLD